MCQQFSYSVSTVLPIDRVWELFADIENWPKFSNVYDHIRWSGFPWTPGSCIIGRIHYPEPLTFRYVLEKCEPASLVTYIAHSTEAGFATHRTIWFEQWQGRTSIRVDSYSVGEPRFAIAGGSYGFIRMLTERWFPAFACFCDKHVEGGRAYPFRMVKSNALGRSKIRC